MPLIKTRPHVSELLSIAVEQQRKKNEATEEILMRPVKIWLSSGNGDTESTSRLLVAMEDRFIVVSFLAEKALRSRAAGIVRLLLAPLAFFLMAYSAETFIHESSDYSSELDTAVFDLDIIVNITFLLLGLLRILGSSIRHRIELAFNRNVETSDLLINSGLAGFVLTLCCLAIPLQSSEGQWVRLFRLTPIAASVFEFVPHINMLMSGVSNGLRSIMFTISLFVLLLLFYGALGHALFAANDPFHFGTYALSFITLFHSATLEDWSVVWAINYGGCASVPSNYQNLSEGLHISTAFGEFDLNGCTQPAAQELVSTFYFLSFVFFGAYVAVSMSLAAVTIGVSERLNDLRTVDVFGEDKEAKIRAASQSKHSHQPAENDNAKAMKMMGSVGNREKKRDLEKRLAACWAEGVDAGAELSNLRSQSKGWRGAVLLVAGIVKTHHEKIFCALVFCDAIMHIVDQSSDEKTIATVVLQLLFNTCFTTIALCKVWVNRARWRWHLKEAWVLFDIITVLTLWVPSIAFTHEELDFINALRILRMALIGRSLSFIPDINIIMSTIPASILSISYVCGIMTLIYYYFAVAGLLLFRHADPFHFSDIGASFRTLLQVMTLANWSSIMRTCMYGCHYFGYESGLTKYDSLCGKSGDGMGWWAPIYFLTFVVGSAFVLISLLIGVIITSMELLREEILQKENISQRMARHVKRYHLSETNVAAMFELFERLDTESNGCLTFKELSDVFGIYGLSEETQFEVYMRIDKDGSGQVDFSEFCEMLAVLRKEKLQSDLEAQAKVSTH